MPNDDLPAGLSYEQEQMLYELATGRRVDDPTVIYSLLAQKTAHAMSLLQQQSKLLDKLEQAVGVLQQHHEQRTHSTQDQTPKAPDPASGAPVSQVWQEAHTRERGPIGLS